MTKFRLCYTYHFVMFVVLLLQIMYLIREGFATCLTVKIPTSQRQAFSFMSRGSEKLMEVLDHMNAKEVREHFISPVRVSSNSGQ